MQTGRFPPDLNSIINFFIQEHGEDKHELRVPVGGQKELPDNVKDQIVSFVSAAGWRVKGFKFQKCGKTHGVRHFVLIKRAAPITRDN